VIDDLTSELAAVIEAFCAGDGVRSVALRVLRGPATGTETSFAGEREQPAASLLKLPLVLTVYAHASDGRLALDEPVPVAHLEQTIYPTILGAFDENRTLSVRELCALALITSDNAAASYLLEMVGVDAVNEYLRTIGCAQAEMAVGFDDTVLGLAGRANRCSANDALSMFTHLYRRPDLTVIDRALRNNLRNQRIPLLLPDEIPVAHKTGTLLGVVNDAGVIYGGASDLAVAFLTDGQIEPARTSLEIGQCTEAIWKILGESPVADPQAAATSASAD
jgi:beta-lactamase class A